MTDQITIGAKNALNTLIAFLDGAVERADTAKAAANQYNQLKGRLGSSEIARKLGLKEPELPFFEASVRDAGRRLDVADDADETTRRNASIAALRFLSWLETFKSNGADIQMPDSIDATINEDVGRKQIRALELIIRSLIDERYGSQENLESELKNLFKPAVVDKWRQSSDAGNLLSGTTFSELASLFVNKQEYPNYANLYGKTAFLNYLRDRRKTIQNFLDDIRRVRNTLAHNKAVTNTQLSLLALYYEELIAPIQDAYDEGQTKVDPSTYIDISQEELDGYFSDLREDIESVKDDIADFRASVEGALGLISEDTKEIKQATEKVKSRTGLIAAGVAVLLIGVGGIFFIASGTREDTAQIKQDTTSIKETTEKTEQNVSDIKTATEQTSQATQEIKISISDMAEGVKALAKSGGLVAKPSNPAEHYHNARILSQRGEVDRAIEMYKRLFAYPIKYADPVIDLVAMLRSRYGEQRLGSLIPQIITGEENTILKDYAVLLSAANVSVKEANSWLDRDPKFYPALVELTRKLIPNDDSWTNLRWRLVWKAELAVVEAANDGIFYAQYIDQLRANTDFSNVNASYRQGDVRQYVDALFPLKARLGKRQTGGGNFLNLSHVPGYWWAELSEIQKPTIDKKSDGSFDLIFHDLCMDPIIGDNFKEAEIRFISNSDRVRIVPIRNRNFGLSYDYRYKMGSWVSYINVDQWCGSPFQIKVDEGVIADLSAHKGQLPTLYWPNGGKYYGCAPDAEVEPLFLEARWTDIDGISHEDRIQVCPSQLYESNFSKDPNAKNCPSKNGIIYCGGLPEDWRSLPIRLKELPSKPRTIATNTLVQSAKRKGLK